MGADEKVGMGFSIINAPPRVLYLGNFSHPPRVYQFSQILILATVRFLSNAVVVKVFKIISV